MAEVQDQAAARLAFVKLVVPDLDAAERFYADAFGLTRLREIPTPEFVERVLAGAQDGLSLIILAWNDGRKIEIGSGYGPVGLIVADLDAAIAASLVAGARLLRGPIDAPAMLLAFIESPDGHEIELLQRKAQ